MNLIIYSIISEKPGPVFDPELRPKGGPGFGLTPRMG